jgi:hypothetical protein
MAALFQGLYRMTLLQAGEGNGLLQYGIRDHQMPWQMNGEHLPSQRLVWTRCNALIGS